MAEGEKIIPINIEDEMKASYIDYSMSVIVSRALPDVRDGLKPVHRRVLFGMLELGVMSNRPYKKSARIVGEVLGKYHPHGDSSVYDTMVRLAQEWSLRYPLIDGQGNFGSIDGDPPAAMRYTEARLRKIAEEMLADIEKDTVDFRPNFDDSLEEPTVMPTRIPNLLINGASGIAVGMATNMPPHNLSEVIDATIAYIDNREIGIDGLMKFVKAPDFPTGGIIYGYSGIREGFETGRGRVVMRARAVIETMENGNRERIIVTEIPYLVNKAQMIANTAALVNEKKLEGISDLRDESDRDGMRIVYELKKDAVANVVLNNLYKYTALQSSFSINNIALVGGRPVMLNLKSLISNFVDFRHEVVVRRTKYDLAQAEKRAHILQGYLIALDHLDEVIRIIRQSATPNEAKEALMSNFGLSEIQSAAILELRLRVLTGMERDKIREEYDDLMKLIEYLRDVLNDEGLRMEIIKDELNEIKTKYGDARRSEIVYAADDQRMEDLIADEDVIVTISHMGYVKRTLLAEYRTQNRGGRGSRGSATRDEDFVEHLFVANTHAYLLFFTEQGRCFWMRAYEIPEGNKTSKGRAIQNMINLPPGDKVRAYIIVKNLTDEEYINNNFILMCTKKGIVKKTSLEAYSRPRANGINAITVRDGDVLVEAALITADDQIMIASKMGRMVRFEQMIMRDGQPVIKFRAMGRNASGVRAIRLAGEQDEVVGMIAIPRDNRPQVLVVSEKGYGKRSAVDDENGEAIYRVTSRGGKGVKTMNITEKTGMVVAIKAVTNENDLMIITSSGITIRLMVADLRVMGRATQGVRLINLGEGDAIAAVTVVETDPEEEHVAVDGSVDTSAADAADEEIDDAGAEDEENGDDGTDVEENNDEK
ncbi:MAG: DNA gyrase subunit A [Bacteroidetes bacterium]|nr:MAG: DNA gyrase subunit A [Bacteroidota bacterium]